MARPERIARAKDRRERRSQEQRRAETRARILRSVLESVAEVGLARTTAVEVTRRAGLTWGAVQYHFGDKDGMLVAAVGESFGRFAARLADVPVAGTSLAARAALFVERAWEHFSSPEYRSVFEILLATREDRKDPESWQGEMFRAWDRVWLRIFWDSKLPRARRLALEHFTISVLVGLAATRMLEADEPPPRRQELDLLVDTLTRELARPS